MAPLPNVSRAFRSLRTPTSAITNPTTAARTSHFPTLPRWSTNTSHAIAPYTNQPTSRPNDRGYQPSRLTTATRTPGNDSSTPWAWPQTSQTPSQIITAASPAFAAARTEAELDPYEVDVGSYAFDFDPLGEETNEVDRRNDFRRYKIDTIVAAFGTEIEADQIRSWSQQLVDDAYDQVILELQGGIQSGIQRGIQSGIQSEIEETIGRMLDDETASLDPSLIEDAILQITQGVDLSDFISYDPIPAASRSSIDEETVFDTSSSPTIRPKETSTSNRTVRKPQRKKLPEFDPDWGYAEAGPSVARTPFTHGFPNPDLTEAEFAEWVSQMFPPPAHTDVDNSQSDFGNTTQQPTHKPDSNPEADAICTAFILANTTLEAKAVDKMTREELLALAFDSQFPSRHQHHRFLDETNPGEDLIDPTPPTTNTRTINTSTARPFTETPIPQTSTNATSKSPRGPRRPLQGPRQLSTN
ncbi:hypothetical protein TREMEDRAFT_60144 [Tremella mesenterica DSM 1558]|uniref:uncharacterized protein n=1 Tax=Tremella mesenterica (strain ATCC 24925 / CBS 8224 / DSM 1558 / NBRC 9311 / NRRL Y-6157 / RJB 2259-6 / UBC 559-6) TaxID=578456 RepID=UPI0003F49234|nr:uncharacterized protein TREMEDRAFT_60144 [Tremella mesenterica DSM 1558]EIW71211.1 hypothetical protein TREMEDRAFT_60144 [Tremella mesenterica DSM 1558]